MPPDLAPDSGVAVLPLEFIALFLPIITRRKAQESQKQYSQSLILNLILIWNCENLRKSFLTFLEIYIYIYIYTYTQTC